jgi:acyl-CoA reductase-like NAD-dependent aldehyde dehydrogenase
MAADPSSLSRLGCISPARFKASGYGRELSTYGIKEFVNIKTVFVR